MTEIRQLIHTMVIKSFSPAALYTNKKLILKINLDDLKDATLDSNSVQTTMRTYLNNNKVHPIVLVDDTYHVKNFLNKKTAFYNFLQGS